MWRKLVFLLKVYNPRNIYISRKERIRKELETTLLKIPTNKGLYTQIYTVGYSHSCTHTQQYITTVIIFNTPPQAGE